MTRRLMTQDELVAALEDAERAEADAKARHEVAVEAAAMPELRTRRAGDAKRRARTEEAKAAADAELAAARAVSVPLVTLRDEAFSAYMEAGARVRELQDATTGEWARVHATLQSGSGLRAMAEPCRATDDGAHTFRIGKTDAPAEQAHGLLVHCEGCHASVVMAESAAVVTLLQALVASGVLPMFPKLAYTVDE